MSKQKTAQQPPNNVPSVATEGSPDVPAYRQCPICWGNRKGVGTAYGKCGHTRYYKCTRNTEGPGCGFTWTALVRIEVVKTEHRIIELSERNGNVGRANEVAMRSNQ